MWIRNRDSRDSLGIVSIRAENLRMDHSGQSTAADFVVRPGSACCLPLLDERRSSQRSKRHSRMWMAQMFPFSRQPVPFSPTARMYIPLKWSKKDCELIGSHCFQSRLRDFDINFGYIFTDIHRKRVYRLIQEFEENALIDDLNALNLMLLELEQTINQLWKCLKERLHII